MGGTSFLRVPTLRAMGTRTGAVLNDSPVGCQSRDLAPPAGGVESPKTNISANSGNRYCLMGDTYFLHVPTPRATGDLSGERSFASFHTGNPRKPLAGRPALRPGAELHFSPVCASLSG